MGARLFTAVLPPETVVAELAKHLEPRLDAGAEHWRWTRPDGWHLTTAFMASVSENAQDMLVENLAGAMARARPFEVGISGALCFPNAARTKVLTMQVAKGHEQLEALSTSSRGAATRAGAAPDGSRFRGHLTLARARRPFDASRWIHVVDSFPGWAWPVTEMVLVQSHMADPGNRYEVLERFPLGGQWPMLDDGP